VGRLNPLGDVKKRGPPKREEEVKKAPALGKVPKKKNPKKGPIGK